MRSQRSPVLALALAAALAACTSAPGNSQTAASPAPSRPAVPSATPRPTTAPFPIAAFAEIREGPVSQAAAAAFLAALREMGGGAGMTATVMTGDGTWSGATGKADGVRDVRVDDQFAIGGVSQPVIAAQVMQMVEAGELALDDPVADRLPPDLGFDTNGATIRHLLGQRSGIPNPDDAVWDSPSADPQRRWTPAEVLKLVSSVRWPAGSIFSYSSTNYLLLGLVIEHVRGRPLTEVLRGGVLKIEGLERLIDQPAEAPTEPMAMPGGESAATLQRGGGYLPSLEGATSGGPGSGMASDSASLARWWRAFCAGEIVSQASLSEMSTLVGAYGLGLYNVAKPYASAVGHTGGHVGYASWAGCLPEDGAVVVVLTNQEVDNIGAMARPLVDAVRSR